MTRLLGTHRWKKARAAFLLQYPLCSPCETAGRATLATLVHHTVPHLNDPSVFWRKEWWEGRCVTCHADAQRVEQSRGRTTETYRGCDEQGLPLDPSHHWQGGEHVPRFSRSYVPDGPPIGDRLTIVCGPPRSGKNTYVDAQRGPTDIVIDLDDYTGTLDQRYAQRDADLEAAAKTNARVWYIACAPKPSDRRQFRANLQPGELVVLEVGAQTCKARTQDPRLRRAIDDWWQGYRREPGDILIHPEWIDRQMGDYAADRGAEVAERHAVSAVL